MNSYTLWRKIHLYSGLAILTFVVMYFLTGYVWIHGNWFPKADSPKTIRTEALTHTGPKVPAAYAKYLEETFDLQGQAVPPRQLEDGSWSFRYRRPGTVYEAVVMPTKSSVRITTTKENVVDTMVSFHRLHGYRGGGVYHVWALIYDLTSLSLIVFAFTGVYLWYRLTKRRLLGWILLGISYGYAGVTILYLMYAP